MALLAAIALAALVLDHVDLLALDLAEDLPRDRGAADVGAADRRLPVPVRITEQQNALEPDLLGPLAYLAEIDVHHVAGGDLDL